MFGDFFFFVLHSWCVLYRLSSPLRQICDCYWTHLTPFLLTFKLLRHVIEKFLILFSQFPASVITCVGVCRAAHLWGHLNDFKPFQCHSLPSAFYKFYTCGRNRWKVCCQPDEVGCRGFAGQSLYWVLEPLRTSGLQGWRLIKCILEASEKTSRWLYKKRGDAWPPQGVS